MLICARLPRGYLNQPNHYEEWAVRGSSVRCDHVVEALEAQRHFLAACFSTRRRADPRNRIKRPCLLRSPHTVTLLRRRLSIPGGAEVQFTSWGSVNGITIY